MKFKNVPKRVRTELNEATSRVRAKIETRKSDLESRLKETLNTIESQEFLKAPYIQDLMKRVQNSVQTKMDHAVVQVGTVVNTRVESVVQQVESVVQKVESAFEKTSDQVKETVRRGQKNIDENVAKVTGENLRAIQKKVAQSILDRAESVRSSISNVTQKVGSDGQPERPTRKVSGKAPTLQPVKEPAVNEPVKQSGKPSAKRALKEVMKNSAATKTAAQKKVTKPAKKKSPVKKVPAFQKSVADKKSSARA